MSEVQDQRLAQIAAKQSELDLYLKRSKAAYKVQEFGNKRVAALKARQQPFAEVEASVKGIVKQIESFDYEVTRLQLELAQLELAIVETEISVAAENDPRVIAARKRDAELLASMQAAAAVKAE